MAKSRKKKVVGKKKVLKVKALKKQKKMPKTELKKYKKLLIKERGKIGEDISNIARNTLNRSQRDAAGDLSGYSFHMADQASDDYERDFSLGRASDEQDLLYTIDEALKRIDDETYGNCPQCGKQIPKKRLNAIPHTELCITCQTKNEGK